MPSPSGRGACCGWAAAWSSAFAAGLCRATVLFGAHRGLLVAYCLSVMYMLLHCFLAVFFSRFHALGRHEVVRPVSS